METNTLRKIKLWTNIMLSFTAMAFLATASVMMLKYDKVIQEILPIWQNTWNVQFFGNLDEMTRSIRDGSSSFPDMAQDIREMRQEFTVMNGSVMSMVAPVQFISDNVSRIQGSVGYMGYAMPQQMYDMNRNVDSMNPMSKMPFGGMSPFW